MQVAEVVAVAVAAAAVDDEDGAQWHGGGSVRQQRRWTMDRRCQGKDGNRHRWCWVATAGVNI